MARTPSGSKVLYLDLQGQGGRSHPRGHHSAKCHLHLGQKDATSAPPSPWVANSTESWLRRQRSREAGHRAQSLWGPRHSLCGDHGTGHSPEFKQQRLLQAQQGCAHREEEDGGTKEDMLWAVAAPQRKRSSGEQEETEAHQPLERKKERKKGRLVPGTELAIV